MIFLLFYFAFALSLVCSGALGANYQIKLHCDEQIVVGASPDCEAAVYDGDTLATDKFTFKWYDDAVPQDTHEDAQTNATSRWKIPFKRQKTNPAMYVVRVDVCHSVIFNWMCPQVGSVGFTIYVTGQLNGQLNITQQNITQEHNFVSTNGTVLHQVSLEKADQEYISQAPTVLSYWFVDCVYYGIGENLSFLFNYSKPEEDHMIETLVMADFTPLPPTTTPPPSSTTSKPTIITKSTTTTAPKSTAATAKLTTAITHRNRRDVDPKNITEIGTQLSNSMSRNNIKVWVNGTLVPYNVSFPFVCGASIVPPDKNKVYGYFSRNITVKAPVSNVTIKGINWLQKGDLLDLEVKCQGSEKMQYCLTYFRGIYNVTNNETCTTYYQLDVCEFPIKRYLQARTEKYTVVIIIKNDVSKIVTPVLVTVYQVKEQAQLSVIVVPVVFILMAVVTIVFGVAYYLQNRSRFVVEVADFDFGQQYADMEYKTFSERLRDSVMNAFTRDPIPSTSDVSVWPPGHKYGSMT